MDTVCFGDFWIVRVVGKAVAKRPRERGLLWRGPLAHLKKPLSGEYPSPPLVGLLGVYGCV